MRTFRLLCLLLVLASVGALGGEPNDRLSVQTSFDIPAQTLSASLRQLAQQAGVQISFEEDLVRGIAAPPLKTRQSVADALRTLLNQTGLIYVASGDAIAVRRAFRLNNESKSPPRSSNRTSANQDTAANSNHLAAAEAASAPAARAAREAPLSRAAAEELEMIVVTGSRLKHLYAEGPSPVHVITRQAIDRSGATTVREVLNTVTQNATSRDESGNPSFLGASTVQLRGLPFGTTLLLLNGRRLGASGAQASANIFDLNNIPLEAVERIEVLTDSATAIYGADAIGGAVNLILREDFDGSGVAAGYGASSHGGDAAERRAAFTIGGKGDTLSGLLVLDYYDRDLLHSSERSLTANSDFSRFGGEDGRSTSAYPGNVYSLDGSPLPGLTSTFAGIPSGTNGIGLTPDDFQATDGMLNLFEPAPYMTLLGGAERKSVFASGHWRPTSSLDLFAEALFTHRTQLIDFAPEPLLFGQFGFFVVPAENPFNPFGVPVGVDYRFVELGPRTNDATTDFSRFVLGASGAVGRFEWQVYGLADRDETEVLNGGTLNSLLNSSVVQQYLDSIDPAVALNVFSTTGNNNPQTLAALLSEGVTTDDLGTRAAMAEAVVRGPLFQLPGGPLSMALGVNYRREKVEFLAPLIVDLRNERSSKAVFAEVSVPLVGPQLEVPAVHSLELMLAGRYDDYDDFDDSTNPQFGLTWRPRSNLLVRASYGEAYKAPTAFQMFLPPIGFQGGGLDPARDNEPTEFFISFGGNPELKPEIGTSRTLGLVWEPQSARGLSITLSAFRVEQEDFITTFDTDLLLANEALFPSRVRRGPPLPGDPPGLPGPILSVDLSNLNFGSLTTQGLDAGLEYAFAPGAWGEFVASLYGTYVDEFQIVLTPGTAAQNVVNHANQSGYPLRFKGSAGLAWHGASGWSAALIARYRGSYTDYDGLSTLASQTLIDAQLARRFGDRGDIGWLRSLEATLGVTNATDQQGEFANTFAGYDFLQSDMRGRFFYVNLKARF